MDKREEVEAEIDDAGANASSFPSGWTIVEEYRNALNEGLSHEEAVDRTTGEIREMLEISARQFVHTVKEQLEKLKEE